VTVYTDSPSYATDVLPWDVPGGLTPLVAPDAVAAPLIQALFVEGRPLWHAPLGDVPWAHVFLSEFSPGSQYDQLIGLARTRHALPDRIASVAGSGLGFHGFKGRAWAAVPGNIHLSVHLAPERPVERFEVAFTVVAALSVVDAIDTIPALRGRAGIKWVNDILVEGAKVAGILAYTQARGDTFGSAILGIGLNVTSTPAVARTPFAPAVGCLRGFAEDSGSGDATPSVRQGPMLGALLESLDRNYRALLSEGFRPLLERYRERSLVLGRDVTICTEESELETTVLAEGRVRALGEGLELYLEGIREPVRGGRLVLDGQIPMAMSSADHGRGTSSTDA